MESWHGQHPLVGRVTETAILWQQFQMATNGQFCVVFVEGEPGVGKSHLLRHLADQASAGEATILWGGASEISGMPPYLPFLESLGGYIRHAPLAALRAQSRASAPILATVLPELVLRLGEVPLGYVLPPDQARYRLFQAFGDFLATIAADKPLLLLLDDLHWADEASFDLLIHLARQLTAVPLLLIAAYRPSEAEQHPPFRRLLAELSRHRRFVNLTLGPLSQQALATLATNMLSQPASSTLLNWLFQHSEGNPFFAEELLRDGVESGRFLWGDGQWNLPNTNATPLLPLGITGPINHRLARLPKDLLPILRTAAVVGHSFPLPLLTVILDQSETGLAQTLQVAVRSRLLQLDKGHAYRFHHDLIRACLLDQLTFVEKQQLHARIGQALLADPLRKGDFAALAYHFAHSGDSEKGATFALQAAAYAMIRFAFAEAIAHYHTADSLLPVDDIRRGQVWHDWGEAARLAGASREAIAAFASAQTWFQRHDDLFAAGKAAHGRGRSCWQIEAIAEAQTAFADALLFLTDWPTVERVAILVDLANLHTLSLLQYDRGRAYSEEALQLANWLDDRRLLVMVKRTIGTLLVRSDDIVSGLILLEESLTLAKAYHDPVEAAEICGFLVVAYVWAARFRDAEKVAQQMIVFAEQAHMVYPQRHIYVIRAILAACSGRFEEAARWQDQAVEIAADLDNPEVLAYLDFGWGSVALAQGAYALAEEKFARLVGRLRAVSPGGVIWFLGLLGIAQGLQGKETAARLCMAEVDTLLRQMPAEAIATYGPLSHLTQIALLLGDQAYLAQVQPCLLRFQGLYYDGLIDRLLAAIAILQKDWAAAERWLDRAEQTTKQEGLVIERVHVLSLRAEMALAQVGVAVARPFLEQGYELLLAAGAMMRADQLAQQLAAMSEPPLAQPIFPAGLSLREVTVLRLVAAGYTNRHIAIDLVISEKTVANHLTHIFNKIGADNRAAAATFAAQHQLL